LADKYATGFYAVYILWLVGIQKYGGCSQNWHTHLYVLSQFTVDVCVPKINIGRVQEYIICQKKSGTNDFGVKTFKGHAK